MSELMRTLISMSLSGAIVTVVLLVMKPLTRKHLSQRWQYYVWLLVVLRLLLPLAPTVTVPSGTLPSVLTRSTPSAVTSAPTTTTPVDTAPGAALQTGKPATSTETSPQTLPVTANGRTTWPASTLLLLIWATGALAVMIWNIAGYTRFKRTAQRTMVRVTDAHFLAILEDCRQEVHVRATPRLYTSASVASPILLGILHPAIVLPDRQLTDNDLRYALLHELTHARRQDGLLKWIAAIAASIHWFNPLSYVMQYELNHSCELSCDETVTRQFSTDDRRGYGSMLLAVASMTGAPSPAMFSAMVEDKRNLKERLGVIMSSKKQTKRTTVVSVMSIALIAAIGILAGCTPKAVPIEGPDVSALMLTNVTASAYDAVPLTWNVGKNTLQSSDTVVLHVNNTDGEAKLCWLPASPATPIHIVQQWSYKNRLPLLTKVTSSNNDLIVRRPPEGIQYASSATGSPLVRWYSGGGSESWVFTQSEIEVPTTPLTPKTNLDGMSIKITERSIWQEWVSQTIDPPKDKILTVPIPAGQVRIVVLYGSGDVNNGFVLIQAEEPFSVVSLWLVRMNNGAGTMVRCGDADAFGGNLIAGQDPSFARFGLVLYFTHGHTKIGCIDTAAASPSVTFPEKINTLLAKLFKEGPQDGVGGPIQAQLAFDGALIIEYPNANRNSVYYALDESGIVLGSLRVDKDSITSLDAQGGQGSTLKTTGSPGYVSFPSYDLFQWNIF